MYVTHNPSTGATEQEYGQIGTEQAMSVLQQVTDGFDTWRATDPAERARLLVAVADGFEASVDELAGAATTEMGKLPSQARAEVQLAASIYRWYGERGVDLLAEETLDVPGARSNVLRTEPIGPLVGVMPWNFPYYQVARFAAPNLLLGNTIILKHAGICARSSALIERIQREAGIPEDAYVNVYVSTDTVAELIADPRVRGVSLTGSEGAGAAVAQVAGKNLKKSVLELGGSDPLLVLDDVDVAETARAVGENRLFNCGQACNSPKRILVPEAMHDQFVAELAEFYRGVTVGPATEEGTDLGPLSSEEARDGIAEQVSTAVKQGATLVAGGTVPDRRGAYYAPTVLTDVTADMDAYSAEIFGPVAVVYRYSDVDEAVRLANDSQFGLSGSVWGADVDRAAEIADRLDVGMAYVNEHGTTRPGLPFGGVGRSGYGRELGRWGLREFANLRLTRVL